jgi:iron complex outermembrane receptor protein
VFGEVRLDEKLGSNRRVRVRGYLDYSNSSRSHSFPMPWLLTRFTTEARWAGMEAHLLEDLSPAHRMTLGAEYREHFRAGFRLFSFGQVRMDEDYPFSLTSAFLQHEWQGRRDLALTGGVRLDHYSNFGTAFSPRLALVYHPGESNTIKLLYGEAFRPPNLWELNYRVPTVAKENPELDPERIETYEVVFERRLTQWATGVVSAFRNEIDGLISSVLDPADGLTQFQNREDTEVLGVEWEVQARTSSGFHAYASLILQEPKNSGTGEPLVNAPKTQARAGLRYPILTWLTAAGSVLHDGKRETVRGEETDAYSLANLHFTADIPGEVLQVSLSVRNLFDRQYWMPVSLQHRQESLEQDGRSLILSLQARF